MSNSCNPERSNSIGSGVSCSLSTDELKNRRNELIPGLFEKSEIIEELDNGFQFVFKRRDKLLTELAELIERENMCCSFLRFVLTIRENGGHVSLEVTGPPGTVELLKSL